MAIMRITKNFFSLHLSVTLFPRHVLVMACWVGLMVAAWPLKPAWALEKYGRPLPSMEEQGDAARKSEETLLGGYFLTSAFVSNPTFAARPDNSGLAGLRHMLHLETDIYKQYLTFYTDQNFFSDRTNGWIKLTEWDMTYALTGLVDRWGWRIQYEQDAPLDRSGIKQIYADALATGRFQASEDLSWWRQHFPNQNLNGYAGFGWLFHNRDYYAESMPVFVEIQKRPPVAVTHSASRLSCDRAPLRVRHVGAGAAIGTL